MKIPEKVKILYKTFSIEEESNLHDGGNDLYGQIHYMSEKMLINSAASDEQKEATLIHELVHGLDETFNIGLKEHQVELVSTALYMLIKDNPEMYCDNKESNREWHDRT